VTNALRGAFADAVIVAAGASSRMGGVDKIDAPILGRSMLSWSLDALAAAKTVRQLIVVAVPGRVEALATDARIARDRLTVIAGGAERSDSVRNGLAATDAEVVLVHDAARPLASPTLIDSVAHAAAEHGAAIPVVAVHDSLKRTDGTAVDRAGLWCAQTPQAARRELLERAFAAAASATFTDEAALLESAGIAVATVPGEVANLKVTEPADLELVRAIAAGRAGEARIGFGSDSHPFGPGDGLRLGGIEIPEAPRLHGHSDGDVVLHAVTTAVLAAAGMGDIGRAFPADDPRTADAPSDDLLTEVIARLAQADLRPSSVSVGIVGARPGLGGDRLDAMRARIAGLVGLAEELVSVSASTGNLSGDEGAGRAISATAVASVVHR
jgi:2-C-methyl-D-erythritol 4-phosphate cytidylyltransferase/2-C-methyl-D-erythritol 2,4-cyclodiphosphate synthase